MALANRVCDARFGYDTALSKCDAGQSDTTGKEGGCYVVLDAHEASTAYSEHQRVCGKRLPGRWVDCEGVRRAVRGLQSVGASVIVVTNGGRGEDLIAQVKQDSALDKRRIEHVSIEANSPVDDLGEALRVAMMHRCAFATNADLATSERSSGPRGSAQEAWDWARDERRLLQIRYDFDGAGAMRLAIPQGFEHHLARKRAAMGLGAGSMAAKHTAVTGQQQLPWRPRPPTEVVAGIPFDDGSCFRNRFGQSSPAASQKTPRSTKAAGTLMLSRGPLRPMAAA